MDEDVIDLNEKCNGKITATPTIIHALQDIKSVDRKIDNNYQAHRRI